MSLNKLYFSKLKKDFMNEKQPEVEDLGYSMACGISLLEGKIHIAVRLQPLPGSPDPIEKDLLAKIKNEVLKDNYKGTPLDIQYIGMVYVHKDKQ